MVLGTRIWFNILMIPPFRLLTECIGSRRLWMINLRGFFLALKISRLRQVQKIIHGDVDFPCWSSFSWKAVWQAKIHERLKFFLWRGSVGGLSIRVNLVSVMLVFPTRCPICEAGEEYEVHLFFQVYVSKSSLVFSKIGYQVGEDCLLG